MSNVLLLFSEKPEKCSQCHDRFYCTCPERFNISAKCPKNCPIKSIPEMVKSGIEDDYCIGWDDAVSVVTNKITCSGSLRYHFFLPVVCKECETCKNKRNFCDCLFAQGVALDPNKRLFSKRRVSECRFYDSSRKDYSSGYRDGLQWMTEQLELEESEK